MAAGMRRQLGHHLQEQYTPLSTVNSTTASPAKLSRQAARFHAAQRIPHEQCGTCATCARQSRQGKAMHPRPGAYHDATPRSRHALTWQRGRGAPEGPAAAVLALWREARVHKWLELGAGLVSHHVDGSLHSNPTQQWKHAWQRAGLQEAAQPQRSCAQHARIACG